MKLFGNQYLNIFMKEAICQIKQDKRSRNVKKITEYWFMLPLHVSVPSRQRWFFFFIVDVIPFMLLSVPLEQVSNTRF